MSSKIYAFCYVDQETGKVRVSSDKYSIAQLRIMKQILIEERKCRPTLSICIVKMTWSPINEY